MIYLYIGEHDDISDLLWQHTRRRRSIAQDEVKGNCAIAIWGYRLAVPGSKDTIILGSFVSTQYRRVTDRRTDGRTEMLYS